MSKLIAQRFASVEVLAVTDATLVVFQAIWLGTAQLLASNRHLPDPCLVVEDLVVAEEDTVDLAEALVEVVEAL